MHPVNVTILESDAATMIIFTEIASWGYETVLHRQHNGPEYFSNLYLDLYLSIPMTCSNSLQFYNINGAVIVYIGVRRLQFQLASPTLFADLKRFVESNNVNY